MSEYDYDILHKLLFLKQKTFSSINVSVRRARTIYLFFKNYVRRKNVKSTAFKLKKNELYLIWNLKRRPRFWVVINNFYEKVYNYLIVFKITKKPNETMRICAGFHFKCITKILPVNASRAVTFQIYLGLNL